MAKIIQRINPAGEKEYPVTSSAAVGMSDGSGNLDQHLQKKEEETNQKLSELEQKIGEGVGGAVGFSIFDYIPDQASMSSLFSIFKDMRVYSKSVENISFWNIRRGGVGRTWGIQFVYKDSSISTGYYINYNSDVEEKYIRTKTKDGDIVEIFVDWNSVPGDGGIGDDKRENLVSSRCFYVFDKLKQDEHENLYVDLKSRLRLDRTIATPLEIGSISYFSKKVSENWASIVLDVYKNIPIKIYGQGGNRDRLWQLTDKDGKVQAVSEPTRRNDIVIPRVDGKITINFNLGIVPYSDIKILILPPDVELNEGSNSVKDYLDNYNDNVKTDHIIRQFIDRFEIYGISVSKFYVSEIKKKVNGLYSIKIKFVESALGYLMDFESADEEKNITYTREDGVVIRLSANWDILASGQQVLNGRKELTFNSKCTNGIGFDVNNAYRLTHNVDYNLHNPISDFEGELGSTGQVYPNTKQKVTEYIKVNPSLVYRIENQNRISSFNEHWEDLGLIEATPDNLYVFNTNIRYIRVSYYKNEEMKIMEYKDRMSTIPIPIVKELSLPNKFDLPNKTLNSSEGIELPYDRNFTFIAKFKFNSNENLPEKKMFRIVLFNSPAYISISLKDEGVLDTHFNELRKKYYFLNRVNYNFNKIPVQSNLSGIQLFSIRIAYPVISSISDTGKTTISETLPTEWEGLWMKNKDGVLSFIKKDSSVVASYTLADYLTIDSLIEKIKQDIPIFEIKSISGDYPANIIEEFDRIDMTILREEIDLDTNTKNGNIYYDCYPCLLKASTKDDIHTININIKQSQAKLEYMEVYIDGLYFMSGNDKYIPAVKNIYSNKILLSKDGNDITILESNIEDYIPIKKPMLQMQHYIEESEDPTTKPLYMSTKRLEQCFCYLKNRGFIFSNLNDVYNDIMNPNGCPLKSVALTYDDYPMQIWKNPNIRKIYGNYGAVATIYQIFPIASLKTEVLPIAEAYPTKEEVEAMYRSGWLLQTHGVNGHTDEMSYYQFQFVFSKLKELYMKWFGIELLWFNPHEKEPKIYQYYLLKSIGYRGMTSGGSDLGHYRAATDSIFDDCVYKRYTWMGDDNVGFDFFKEQVNSYLKGL